MTYRMRPYPRIAIGQRIRLPNSAMHIAGTVIEIAPSGYSGRVKPDDDRQWDGRYPYYFAGELLDMDGRKLRRF